MKALKMETASEFAKAVKHPIRNMKILCGGIGRRTLTPLQIKKLRAEMKREKETRKERNEWERFVRKMYK